MTRPDRVAAYEDIAPEELVEGGTSLPAHGSGKIVGPGSSPRTESAAKRCVEGHRMLGLRDPVLADEEQDARSCQGEPDRGVDREAKDEPRRGDRLSTTRSRWEGRTGSPPLRGIVG